MINLISEKKVKEVKRNGRFCGLFVFLGHTISSHIASKQSGLGCLKGGYRHPLDAKEEGLLWTPIQGELQYS